MRVIRTKGMTGAYPVYNNMPTVNLPSAEVLGLRMPWEYDRPWYYSDDTHYWESQRPSELQRARESYMSGFPIGTEDPATDPRMNNAIEPMTGADLTPMGDVIPFMEAAAMAADGDYANAGLATAAALASLFIPYRIQGPLRNGKGAVPIDEFNTPFNVPAVNAAPNPYVQIVDPMNEIIETELGKNLLLNGYKYKTTQELAQEYGDDFVDYTLDRAKQNMNQSGVSQLYPDVVKQLSLLGAFDYLDDFQIDPIRMSNLNLMLGDLANNPNVRSVITPQEFPGLLSGNMPLEDAFDAYSRNEIQRRSDDIIFDYMRKNGMLQDTPNYTAALGRTNTQNQGHLGHAIASLVDAERAGMGQWDEIPLTARLATNMNEVANGLFIPSPGVRTEYGGFGSNALAQRLLDRYIQEMSGGFSLSKTPVFRGMKRDAVDASVQEALNKGVQGGLGATPASVLGSSWSLDPYTAEAFNPNVLISQIGDGENVLLPNIFPDPRFPSESEIMRNPLMDYDLFNTNPARGNMTYARPQGFKKGGKFKVKKKK